MWKQNRELWLSLLAVTSITLVYALFTRQTRLIPPASGLFGHIIGVIGFLFMLMAETLYSYRKRSHKASWGKMSNWLQFHIFTGIVGPFMVLLHTSWKFNGLAGATLALTMIIVFSGFVGRYIYTRIPRIVDGIEIPSSTSEEQALNLVKMRRTLAVWYAIHIPIGVALFVASFIHIVAALYYSTLLF